MAVSYVSVDGELVELQRRSRRLIAADRHGAQRRPVGARDLCACRISAAGVAGRSASRPARIDFAARAGAAAVRRDLSDRRRRQPRDPRLPGDARCRALSSRSIASSRARRRATGSASMSRSKTRLRPNSHERPPQRAADAACSRRSLWSLKLRYWAWRVSGQRRGTRGYPDIRAVPRPGAHARPCRTRSASPRDSIGVVYAFADALDGRRERRGDRA